MFKQTVSFERQITLFEGQMGKPFGGGGGENKWTTLFEGQTDTPFFWEQWTHFEGQSQPLLRGKQTAKVSVNIIQEWIHHSRMCKQTASVEGQINSSF